jgi:anti-sigma-K factor RskA
MSDDKHATDLLPGLALGSLEPNEERQARDHLARCVACRDELDALEEVMGRMALALPRADPPPGLEKKIMDRIQGTRRAAATRDARPRAAFFRHPAFGAAAAVLIVLLGAGNLVQWFRGAPARGPGAPGLTTIVLVGVNTGQGAYGTVVLDAQDNGGVLAVRGLPRLDMGHQYQLWLVRDGERQSGGVFSVDEDGYGNLLLQVPKDFKGFTSIGITVEPAGGSPAPTGARVAGGKV